MMSKQPEKNWKEIGATIGAAIDLASYAHSKLSDSKPAPAPEPVREPPPVDRRARERADARFAIPVICGLLATVGIAAVLFLPKPAVPPALPVCQYAPAAQVAASVPAASAPAAAAPASAVPLNLPCREPYNDGLTPGERIAGGIAVTGIKAIIFSIL